MFLSYLLMCLRHAKTLEDFAQVNTKMQVNTTKEISSIELFLVLWCKVGTQQKEMEQEEFQYMVRNSRTNKFGTLTLIKVSFQWQMLDLTQTDHSSLFAMVQLLILTKSTLSSEELSMDTKFANWLSRIRLVHKINQSSLLPLLIVASWKETIN